MTVFVSHFGLANGEKKNAVATLLKALKDVKGNVIFMGDLNMEPDCPILAPVFEALKDTSAILPEHPLTFAWYKPELRIDYIFTSENIKTLSAQSPYETTSDHQPYIAELELQEPSSHCFIRKLHEKCPKKGFFASLGRFLRKIFCAGK